MRTQSVYLVGIGLAAVLATSAMAQPVFTYEFSQFTSDFQPQPDLSRQIEFEDLIAFYELSYNGFFEGGMIDAANNVQAFNFNALNCLEQYDGVENAFAWPVSTFWRDDPQFYGDPVSWMPFLTDGDGVMAVPFNDFARASNVVRYDFDEPTDIGEILVWTEFESWGSGRLFMCYDVFVSYDSSTEGLTPLVFDVRNGEWGYSTNPPSNEYMSSYTLLYDCSSDVLASGVTKVRFVFYPVTYQGSDLMADAWRGYWHPANSATWNYCEEKGTPEDPSDDLPADPRDLDGRQKTFVASWVTEIDVLGPQPMATPGDGDGDGFIDMTDVNLMLTAATGPAGSDGLEYDDRAFDFAAKDCDIDLADFAAMQPLVVP